MIVKFQENHVKKFFVDVKKGDAQTLIKAKIFKEDSPNKIEVCFFTSRLKQIEWCQKNEYKFDGEIILKIVEQVQFEDVPNDYFIYDTKC